MVVGGNVTLSAGNNYSGPTTFNVGTLTAGSSLAGQAITVNGSGLNLNTPRTGTALMVPDGASTRGITGASIATANFSAGTGSLNAANQLLKAVLARTPDGPTRGGLVAMGRIGLECLLESAVYAPGNGSNVISSDTVPFCIWAACRHLRNYEDALWDNISALGDRDTTCAILGSIVAMTDWLRERQAQARVVSWVSKVS